VERDSLTGLANRAGIHRWLQAALPRVCDGERTLMVAFLDVDRFKPINDTYGHAVGDEILRGLGDGLRAFGRVDDLRGRLGGDEFVVAAVLPATADREAWADRVGAAAHVRVGDVHAGASIGVAAVTDPRTSVEQVLHRADEAMYRRKHRTRDALTTAIL
jgi:diguanylate cyclase (GGDEF)-like protein